MPTTTATCSSTTTTNTTTTRSPTITTANTATRWMLGLLTLPFLIVGLLEYLTVDGKWTDGEGAAFGVGLGLCAWASGQAIFIAYVRKEATIACSAFSHLYLRHRQHNLHTSHAHMPKLLTVTRLPNFHHPSA